MLLNGTPAIIIYNTTYMVYSQLFKGINIKSKAKYGAFNEIYPIKNPRRKKSLSYNDKSPLIILI